VRILVGTLHYGENEYEMCCRSIERQSFTNFKHETISGLPNAEAHDTLYRSFLDRADGFNLLVKVDADMVLTDRNFLQHVADRFTDNPGLDVLAIAVWDFFSNRLIPSLNCYRNSIIWEGPSELQTDNVEATGQWYMDWTELAPAATHCFNPLPLHAFHYGVHRGMKARVAAEQTRGCLGAIWRNKRPYLRLEDQLSNIALLHQNYRRVRDPRLGMAAIGAELALRGEFSIEDLDYGAGVLETAVQRYEALSPDELWSQLRKLRRGSSACLPYGMRMEWMRHDPLLFSVRSVVPGDLLRSGAKSVARILRNLRNAPSKSTRDSEFLHGP